MFPHLYSVFFVFKLQAISEENTRVHAEMAKRMLEVRLPQNIFMQDLQKI